MSGVSPAVAAVDWGTSSFRLWLLAADGTVLGERRSDQGMSRLAQPEFGPVLEAQLDAVDAPRDLPVVACGMVGARQGWHEAAYIQVPAPLAMVPRSALRVPGIDRDVRILPGLSQIDPGREDVIRGEETILLGTGGSGVFCLPGTHSKWVRLDDGAVGRFATAMTGEMFDLLARRSTLSHALAGAEPTEADATAFDAAIKEAIQAPERSLSVLFTVRAAGLVQSGMTPGQLTERLSGLLIGLELAGAREFLTGPVTLVSQGLLARKYARAFDVAGIDFVAADADTLVRTGLLAAAREIWGLPGG